MIIVDFDISEAIGSTIPNFRRNGGINRPQMVGLTTIAFPWVSHISDFRSKSAISTGLGLQLRQACALIEAMNSPGACRAHVLVVMPVTLLDQWAKELESWGH